MRRCLYGQSVCFFKLKTCLEYIRKGRKKSAIIITYPWLKVITCDRMSNMMLLWIWMKSLIICIVWVILLISEKHNQRISTNYEDSRFRRPNYKLITEIILHIGRCEYLIVYRFVTMPSFPIISLPSTITNVNALFLGFSSLFVLSIRQQERLTTLVSYSCSPLSRVDLMGSVSPSRTAG